MDFRVVSFDWLNCNDGFLLFTNATNEAIKDSIQYYRNLDLNYFYNSEIVDSITDGLIGNGFFCKVLANNSNEFDNEFYFDIYQLVKIGLYVDLDICEIRTQKNND